ncbi:hypothetical protein ABZ471_25295 [Streptomyces sp. NPDC005728]|uniref:hypothetical protein n=1 Tax=Streptomyces sp. NPDC005728 TaxID=3157054 RepID=UPI0033F60293
MRAWHAVAATSSGPASCSCRLQLRCGHTRAQLTTGFDIGTITAYQYLAGAVEIVENKMPQDLIGSSSRHCFGDSPEAATTGHLPDIKTPVIPAHHDPAQAAIFSDVVNAYGRHIANDRQGGMPAGLRHSMGGMMSDHIGDIHQLLGQERDVPTDLSGLPIEKKGLVPVMHAMAEDGHPFGQVHDAETSYVSQELNKYDGQAFFEEHAPGADKLTALQDCPTWRDGTLHRRMAAVLMTATTGLTQQLGRSKTSFKGARHRSPVTREACPDRRNGVRPPGLQRAREVHRGVCDRERLQAVELLARYRKRPYALHRLAGSVPGPAGRLRFRPRVHDAEV